MDGVEAQGTDMQAPPAPAGVRILDQTSLSLADRCKHFIYEFSLAKINLTLLRKVYTLHRIREKKLRWIKAAKAQDQEKHRQ